MRLPDFLIIGAMKSGTSSMHHYLEQHPDVFTSARKEIDFFTRHYDRGLRWYKRQFGAGVAGESSPNYLKAHLWPDTAARIHKHLPDVRLLCVLRNPVDRTLSHYLHNVRSGRERRPFSQHFSANSKLIKTSLYAWQLNHYLVHFPPEQLILTTTEDLSSYPEATTRKLLRFIGVDDSVAIDTSKRHNVTATKLAQSGAQVPDDPAVVADADGIRLAPSAQARLADMFRADVARLRSTWPEFPGWDL